MANDRCHFKRIKLGWVEIPALFFNYNGVDMSFLTDLDAEFERGTNRAVLTSPLIYQDTKAGIHYVPYGFETDFASIPRLLWAYIAPEDPCIRDAAVVHDYLYVTKDPHISRKDADKLLVEMMDVLGASGFKKFVVYWSVRLCGASHWK